MDSDRKSTVSSFYGGRKGSMDALNTDYPSHHPPGRAARDDASSFFSPDSRPSMELLHTRNVSAGYNSSSFYPGREEPLKGGRDEEEPEAWDVYADFNNAGPKYSSAYVHTAPTNAQDYQRLDHGTPTKVDTPSIVAPEMVTVPGLGAEWTKTELRDMTKSGRKEKKYESRREKWKQWNRGERGMCGNFCTRRFFVWFMFGLVAAIALVLAFCIPRVPRFSFNSETPLVNATGEWAQAVRYGFPRAPANFSFPAFASLQLDTDNNFVPITIRHMRSTVYDLETGRQVGTGDLTQSEKLAPKSFPEILLPLNFTYIATNDTDQTWANWYNGCRNKQFYPGGARPPLRFRLIIELDIFGLPGSPRVSTQIFDAGCPFELSMNSP